MGRADDPALPPLASPGAAIGLPRASPAGARRAQRDREAAIIPTLMTRGRSVGRSVEEEGGGGLQEINARMTCIRTNNWYVLGIFSIMHTSTVLVFVWLQREKTISASD